MARDRAQWGIDTRARPRDLQGPVGVVALARGAPRPVDTAT